MSTLPDPKLYIIVDGQPTKDKVVWQGLVDVDNVKRAAELLRDRNWLYKTVLMKLQKKAVEVVSTATSPMLERASEDDVHDLQS